VNRIEILVIIVLLPSPPFFFSFQKQNI